MMKRIAQRNLLSNLRSRSEGAVAVEYALLGAFLGLGIIAALMSTKSSLNSNFDNITYRIGQATPKANTAPRVVSSTSTANQTVNGVVTYQTYTYYTDGSKSLYQTNSNNAANGWKTAQFDWDTAGNLSTLSVTNPDGTPQYSVAYTPVRPGVMVDTITDTTGVPYTFQETTDTNGPISTITRVMMTANNRTDLWQTQTITNDYTNPSNIIVKSTCQYAGGRTVAC